MSKEMNLNYICLIQDEWFDMGFLECKKRVLKILEKDLQNLDLSTDSCDKRYIEKIKSL